MGVSPRPQVRVSNGGRCVQGGVGGRVTATRDAPGLQGTAWEPRTVALPSHGRNTDPERPRGCGWEAEEAMPGPSLMGSTGSSQDLWTPGHPGGSPIPHSTPHSAPQDIQLIPQILLSGECVAQIWGPGPAASARCGNMLEMQTPRPHLRPVGTLSPLMRQGVSTRSTHGPFPGRLASLWGTRLGHLYLVRWGGGHCGPLGSSPTPQHFKGPMDPSAWGGRVGPG